MEITLAKDEVLIKQYDYASTKSKHDVVMHSVIVTDKRIIAQEQGERSFARDEMPLDHADYIVTDFDSYKKPVKLAIVLFIISAILAIGGLVWSLLTKDTYWFLIPTGLSVVVLVFAIIALILALTRKGATAELEIRSRQPAYEMFSFCANGIKPISRLDRLKIKVDREVAEQMLNEIGALILNYKNK